MKFKGAVKVAYVFQVNQIDEAAVLRPPFSAR